MAVGAAPWFAGLTDDEYRWEPVPGMWSVRPRGTSPAPASLGNGAFTEDFAGRSPTRPRSPPSPGACATCWWRVRHGVAAHFGGDPVRYDTYDYPGDADTALARLDAAYAAWNAGVRALTLDDLARPRGRRGPSAEYPMAALVLHINREAIHYGAEVALFATCTAPSPSPTPPHPTPAAPPGAGSSPFGSLARSAARSTPFAPPTPGERGLLRHRPASHRTLAADNSKKRSALRAPAP